MKFWLTVSTNGVSTRICHKSNDFCLPWFRLGCAWLWWTEINLRKTRWLFCFVILTRFSGKAMSTITTKQHICRFLVLQKNIQNVTTGFALFTVVGIGNSVSWKVSTLFVWACWTIHISNNFLNWFFCLFKNINSWPNSRKTSIIVLPNENCASDTCTSVEDIDILSIGLIVFLCTQSVFVKVNPIFNHGIVITTITVKCTTYRNRFHLIHTCLRGIIGCSRKGDFRDG